MGTIFRSTDFEVWRSHFGLAAGSVAALPSAASLSAKVPEPPCLALLVFGASALTVFRIRRSTVCLFASLSIALTGQVSRADIVDWEYINPGTPGLGRQPSTMLVPDGAGANAVPGTDPSNRNLTKA